MLRHILPLLVPRPGETNYVEVFGGSGVVLLNKARHVSEVYNDLNGEIVNLFRVIRNPALAPLLFYELSNTPVSREEFRDSLDEYKKAGAVARAARLVVRCRQSFGGLAATRKRERLSDRDFGLTKDCVRGGGHSQSAIGAPRAGVSLTG